MDNKTVYVIDYCRLQSKSKHHHRAITLWHSWRSSLLYQWKIEPNKKKTTKISMSISNISLWFCFANRVRRQVPISEMSCYTQTIFIDVQIFHIHSITSLSFVYICRIAIFWFWSGMAWSGFISFTLHGSIKTKIEFLHNSWKFYSIQINN